MVLRKKIYFGQKNFLKKLVHKISLPKEPKTKFGGQPDWLVSPQWPISKTTGKPMGFVGQVALDKDLYPESQGKMAYIFMAIDDEGELDAPETWDPRAGDNAVIIQPHGIYPLPVNEEIKIQPLDFGPTISPEFSVRLEVEQEPQLNLNEEIDEEILEIYEDILGANKIGGIPRFIQGDEYPDDRDEWHLLLQLDSVRVPFYINFGDGGVGYIFINKSGTKGWFLWQSS